MKEIFKVQPKEKGPETERTGEKTKLENIDQEQAEQDLRRYEAERQESLDEAREKIKEVPEGQELDSEKVGEQGELSADEFFQEARTVEEQGDMKKPKKFSINSEALNNFGMAKEVRDETAKRKVSEVVAALTEVYDDLKDIKEKVGTIMDIGAGWGENLRDLAEELEAEKAIGVDTNTISSKKVKKEMGDKLAWVVGDALETMKKLKSGSVDLTTAFAFLQVLDRNGKIAMLREMGEVAKEGIVIVDELKRGIVYGSIDLVKNKAFNAFQGKFNVLEEGEWKEIFEKAGLAIEAFNKFGNNDFVAVLKKVEKAEEVE